MTDVVFVGKLYNAGLEVGGGPVYPPAQPPGIWPSPGHPAHPIAPGTPPGIWGGPPLYPDQGLPGAPPGIWPSPGHPAHPIAPGGRPPGIWGGPPLYPDQGLPQPPLGIWGGGNVPMPNPPMVPPTEAVWVIGYAPGYGATWVQVKPVEPPPAPTEPGTEPEPTPT
jgi:hypothetical protein